MGIPIRQLYATNIDGEILLSKYIPLQDNGDYRRPPETPLGHDLWVPNVIGLKAEEGTVPVMVVRSDEETGIWLVCFDDYFGNEQHLYVHKPRFVEGTKKLDWVYEDDESNNFDMGLHISSDIEMVAGDGPYPVTLQRGEYPERTRQTRKKPRMLDRTDLLIIIGGVIWALWGFTRADLWFIVLCVYLVVITILTILSEFRNRRDAN